MCVLTIELIQPGLCQFNGRWADNFPTGSVENGAALIAGHRWLNQFNAPAAIALEIDLS